MSGTEVDRSGNQDRGAWDAYAAAAITGLVTGLVRAHQPDVGPDSPTVWAGAILYVGTLALISLSTTDGARRFRRFVACAGIALAGMAAGPMLARLLQ